MVTGILSPIHVAFLLVIAVLLFGAKRLPELGSSLGRGLHDFKDSLEGTNARDAAEVANAVDAPASSGPAADEEPPSPPVS